MSTMDCNELVELVTAYLDGALDPQTRARFDSHLRECDGCENYLQQFREPCAPSAATNSIRRSAPGCSTRSRTFADQLSIRPSRLTSQLRRSGP
jgi:hypothetical protein